MLEFNEKSKEDALKFSTLCKKSSIAITEGK